MRNPHHHISEMPKFLSLDMFKKNPQRYIEDVSKIVSINMKSMLVDGIKYTRLGDDEWSCLIRKSLQDIWSII